MFNRPLNSDKHLVYYDFKILFLFSNRIPKTCSVLNRGESGERRLSSRTITIQSPPFSQLESYRMRQLDDNENDTVGDNAVDDEEASERDRHNSTRSNLDDDAHEVLRNENAVQEVESDTEFFHEAKTESDSNDNQSTQDAQRSL